MPVKSALLWMTHVWDNEIEAEFERILHTAYPDSPEVWLIIDSRTPGATELARRFGRCHIIIESELFRRLSYPHIKTYRKATQLYGHVHFPVLDFYFSHPEYDYYWVIEYDVRYNGDWGSFLRSFELFDHDLITSHIRCFAEEPYFYWWNSFEHPIKTINRSGYVRSFNVIYRISHRAIALIHGAQQDGWRGHPEVLLPTLLDYCGYTLLDFGGDGKYTPPALRNTTYTSGSTRDGLLNPFCTMCWRPSKARAGMRKNKIYHPVKPASMLEPLSERLRFFTRWTGKYIFEKLTVHS